MASTVFGERGWAAVFARALAHNAAAAPATAPARRAAPERPYQPMAMAGPVSPMRHSRSIGRNLGVGGSRTKTRQKVRMDAVMATAMMSTRDTSDGP